MLTEVSEVTSEFAMSAESLAALEADPAAAVEGLQTGIASALGVDPALVALYDDDDLQNLVKMWSNVCQILATSSKMFASNIAFFSIFKIYKILQTSV